MITDTRGPRTGTSGRNGSLGSTPSSAPTRPRTRISAGANNLPARPVAPCSTTSATVASIRKAPPGARSSRPSVSSSRNHPAVSCGASRTRAHQVSIEPLEPWHRHVPGVPFFDEKATRVREPRAGSLVVQKLDERPGQLVRTFVGDEQPGLSVGYDGSGSRRPGSR